MNYSELLEKKNEEFMEKNFLKLKKGKLQTYFNILFENVHKETLRIYSYLNEKINKFAQIFQIIRIQDMLNHLEDISIQNNCECAGIIDIIPCWRCLDCTDYDSIYCSKCYLKSKDLHKGHKINFLPSVEGMCDCGDPNSLRTFCSDHKGPLSNQKQINEFIEKSFSPDILNKLKIYFEDLFNEFSKYLILTEQCNFFCTEIYLNNIHNEREKQDATF